MNTKVAHSPEWEASDAHEPRRTDAADARYIRVFVKRCSLRYNCALRMLLNHLSVENPSLELNTDSRGAGGQGTPKTHNRRLPLVHHKHWQTHTTHTERT